MAQLSALTIPDLLPTNGIIPNMDLRDLFLAQSPLRVRMGLFSVFSTAKPIRYGARIPVNLAERHQVEYSLYIHSLSVEHGEGSNHGNSICEMGQ